MNDIDSITVKAYRQNYKNYITKFGDTSRNEVVQSGLDEFCNILNGKKVLDIGCADGGYSNYIAQKGFEVVGIDIVSEFIEYARLTHSHVKFELMNMKQMSFPSNSFDGIFAIASLLHLEKNQLDVVLKKIYNILKKDGVLFFTLKAGIGEKFVPDQFDLNQQRYFSLYTQTEIQEILEKLNFNVIEITEKEFEFNMSTRKPWLAIYAKK